MGEGLHPENDSGELISRPPEISDLVELCGKLNAAGGKYVVVGGLAMVQAGYPRFTGDIDLLIEKSLENETVVLNVLGELPDGVAKQLQPGEISKYGVVRVADEIVVDLLVSGCGVTYEDAIPDAKWVTIDGAAIPFASKTTLWKMKQTVREKDIPDRLFLRQALLREGVVLEPSVSNDRDPLARAPRWLRRILDRLFGA